jgi:hypothetical protein
MIDRRFAVALTLAFALFVPALTQAQHPQKVHRIGFLALIPGEDATLMKPLTERLRELGHVEGQNLISGALRFYEEEQATT